MKPRVIPVLSLKNGGLVKTRRYQDPKYVGDPTNAIRIFNEKEVDELVVLDIGASSAGTAPDFEVVRLFAEECFMPLTYGGGIQNMQQVERIFDLGIEKVSLQSAVMHDTRLIQDIARVYGQQSVVLGVDIKKNWLKQPKLYISQSGKLLNRPIYDYLAERVDAGVGEVLLSAVDHDGMMDGYDLDLIHSVASRLPVPVVALGGARSMDDFNLALKAGASAVAAGAMFVFKGPHRAVLINYPKRAEFDSLDDIE
ncbi:AglZ/HisF2 family acetamidino modification protein [Alcaligenes faecalis]|uniref:AglZ/HisF2 family acetamidino modification protein n=1 Tax=Alcaligenes faecalis TaxID=511 RepID=UPI0005A5E284|nr:AglZ/HisF2 family acetamidino modification protein [Alcaligenes faecalis]ATI01011.1 imidazole glycerol phosphate synthase subunit HisF [Alcaligenes faecalis]AYZ90370.1 imidazole glycerol phosphate synthase subunit HisF [Alcaligenes faecalis]MCX5594981.1 AglZ/HisF2 family acetamidino modification protein [Alcaligenes faecalis]QQC33810.1 imidazole glycerol phosphate synthase subunit HisF [Alcaligenes faecalis]CAJ0909954.1 putative imidazole glycerol phosphate synthase subunit HisF [Alcaligene